MINPLSLVARLPLLPLQGTIRLGQLIQEQVEREHHNPASIRRQLEETEAQAASGTISEAEQARAQQKALSRAGATRRTQGPDPAAGNRR